MGAHAGRSQCAEVVQCGGGAEQSWTDGFGGRTGWLAGSWASGVLKRWWQQREPHTQALGGKRSARPVGAGGLLVGQGGPPKTLV